MEKVFGIWYRSFHRRLMHDKRRNLRSPQTNERTVDKFLGETDKTAWEAFREIVDNFQSRHKVSSYRHLAEDEGIQYITQNTVTRTPWSKRYLVTCKP
jgi:hypothetical protein